jgi:hypothetical protein
VAENECCELVSEIDVKVDIDRREFVIWDVVIRHDQERRLLGTDIAIIDGSTDSATDTELFVDL